MQEIKLDYYTTDEGDYMDSFETLTIKCNIDATDEKDKLLQIAKRIGIHLHINKIHVAIIENIIYNNVYISVKDSIHVTNIIEDYQELLYTYDGIRNKI